MAKFGRARRTVCWFSARARHVVERLERDFDRTRRILVPNLSDWTQTGKVLARMAAEYDYEQIERGRLTNDALIAMSAGRLGITVITANARDFRKLVRIPFFSPSSGGQRRSRSPAR